MKAQYKGRIVNVAATATRTDRWGEVKTLHLYENSMGGGNSITVLKNKAYSIEVYTDTPLLNSFNPYQVKSYADYRWVFDNEIQLLPNTNRGSAHLLLSDSLEQKEEV